MYANHIGYSDINPHEVTKECTPRKKMIRYMDSELDPNWKRDFIPGGFLGHTVNNGGEWIITSNPDAPEFAIRLNKKGQWMDKHGRRYLIADAPVKYYDYNF
jgi:hypothetical protein